MTRGSPGPSTGPPGAGGGWCASFHVQAAPETVKFFDHFHLDEVHRRHRAVRAILHDDAGVEDATQQSWLAVYKVVLTPARPQGAGGGLKTSAPPMGSRARSGWLPV